jgi:hypothetical protein
MQWPTHTKGGFNVIEKNLIDETDTVCHQAKAEIGFVKYRSKKKS